MTDELRYEVDGHVGLITLDRPEARNALTYELYGALEQAVRAAQVRCLVITGADPAFCAGDDVKQILSKTGDTAASPVTREPTLTPAAEALLRTDIPVVAAVNGVAVGWGMELALMADIRVASERARFGELFVKRGLCCDVPGLGRLAQLVGREAAAELLFTGRVVDAEEALRLRMVSRVVPHEDLLPTAPGSRPPDRREPTAGGGQAQGGAAAGPRPRLGPPGRLGHLQPLRALPHRGPPRGRRRLPREARPGLPRVLTAPLGHRGGGRGGTMP